MLFLTSNIFMTFAEKCFWSLCILDQQAMNEQTGTFPNVSDSHDCLIVKVTTLRSGKSTELLFQCKLWGNQIEDAKISTTTVLSRNQFQNLPKNTIKLWNFVTMSTIYFMA